MLGTISGSMMLTHGNKEHTNKKMIEPINIYIAKSNIENNISYSSELYLKLGVNLKTIKDLRHQIKTKIAFDLLKNTQNITKINKDLDELKKQFSDSKLSGIVMETAKIKIKIFELSDKLKKSTNQEKNSGHNLKDLKIF